MFRFRLFRHGAGGTKNPDVVGRMGRTQSGLVKRITFRTPCQAFVQVYCTGSMEDSEVTKKAAEFDMGVELGPLLRSVNDIPCQASSVPDGTSLTRPRTDSGSRTPGVSGRSGITSSVCGSDLAGSATGARLQTIADVAAGLGCRSFPVGASQFLLTGDATAEPFAERWLGRRIDSLSSHRRESLP